MNAPLQPPKVVEIAPLIAHLSDRDGPWVANFLGSFIQSADEVLRISGVAVSPSETERFAKVVHALREKSREGADTITEPELAVLLGQHMPNENGAQQDGKALAARIFFEMARNNKPGAPGFA